MTEDFSGKIGFRDTVLRFLTETKVPYLFETGADPMTAYQFLGLLREEAQNRIKRLEEMNYATVTNPKHKLLTLHENLISLQADLTDLRDQCLAIAGSGLVRQNPPNLIIEQIVGRPLSLNVKDFKSLFQNVVNKSQEYLITKATLASASEMHKNKALVDRLRVFCEDYKNTFSSLFDEHGVPFEERDLTPLLPTENKRHARE